MNTELDYVNHITRYFDVLRQKFGLEVSFCDYGTGFNQVAHLLYNYGFHVNDYCKCIKSNLKARQHCFDKQFKIGQKDNTAPFYGACWAGVEEYVFPIVSQNKYLGFISVSGYRGTVDSAHPRVAAAAKRFGLSHELLEQKYEKLNLDPPSQAEVEALINPLCDMFDLLYRSTKHDEKPQDSIYMNILNYIYGNFHHGITIEEIAERCNCSPAYVRYIFNKKNGQTVKQFVNNLRLKRAKEYLEFTDKTVSEIAFDLSFCDSNYFANAFKKATGLTPSEYRKQHNSHDKELSDSLADFHYY